MVQSKHLHYLFWLLYGYKWYQRFKRTPLIRTLIVVFLVTVLVIFNRLTSQESLKQVHVLLHARIQKVLSDGANFDGFLLLFLFCLVGEGREDPNATGHYLRWRADDGPTLNAG